MSGLVQHPYFVQHGRQRVGSMLKLSDLHDDSSMFPVPSHMGGKAPYRCGIGSRRNEGKMEACARVQGATSCSDLLTLEGEGDEHVLTHPSDSWASQIQRCYHARGCVVVDAVAYWLFLLTERIRGGLHSRE